MSQDFLIDFRCPACDLPLFGVTEVKHASGVPQIAKCQHCHTPIKRVDEQTDLGSEVYWTDGK